MNYSAFSFLFLALLPLTTFASLSIPSLTYKHHAKPLYKRAYHTLSKRGGSEKFHGRATFYATGLGACGATNTDSDFIVALNQPQYQANKWCGKMITVSYGGKSHEAQIQDECPGCPEGGLDMSPALFKYFASEDAGVFYMSWTLNDGGGSSDSGSAQSSSQDGSSDKDKSKDGQTSKSEPSDSKKQDDKSDQKEAKPAPVPTYKPPPPAYTPPPTPADTPPPAAAYTPAPAAYTPPPTPANAKDDSLNDSAPSPTSKPKPTYAFTPPKVIESPFAHVNFSKTTTATSKANNSAAVAKGYVVSSAAYGQAEGTTAYATDGNLDVVSQLVICFGSLTAASASHAISNGPSQ